jgi:hypothetical protein
MTLSQYEEDNSGQTRILARDGLSANDPKADIVDCAAQDQEKGQ